MSVRACVRACTKPKRDAREKEKLSYRSGGAMDALSLCADASREESYIIYCVLSPGGPSVMAVLYPIKITTGAPRRAHRCGLGSPGNQTDLFPEYLTRPALRYPPR